MSIEKPKAVKTSLHPRNKNRERYDLAALIVAYPRLADYIKPNKFGGDSVDFSNPKAVKLLNQALLKHYYGIEHWSFPEQNLCPPIPGRADYLHHIADLLGESNGGQIPTGDKITCLDIGVGASCIYPIIGATAYQWNFIGSDIDAKTIESAQNIVQANPPLKDKVALRWQRNPKAIFREIIKAGEQIDLTICNPPFHESIEAAQKGSRRKVKNLSGKKVKKAKLNFSGTNHELVYEGGERRFIQNMINESHAFAKNCCWFSTLVSKEKNLKGIIKSLESLPINQIRTIPMGTGNKNTRIVAWSFLSAIEQKEWQKTRWKA